MRKVYQFLNLLPDTTLSDQAVSGGVFGGTDGASKALLKQASGFLLNSSHVKMSVDKFFPSEFF